MATPQDFTALVNAIISRNPDTSLSDRWEEAQAIDPNPTPPAYWIRESEDVINIVWLTVRGIIDITWMPTSQTGTFNYLQLSSVMEVEIRQAPRLSQQMGLSVSGDLVVRVRTPSHQSGLIWVASADPHNVRTLRDFTGQVLKRVV
jgi:hypothetical protein